MINLNTVSKRPKEGCYIAVWIHDKTLWSKSFKYIAKILYKYEEELDEWVKVKRKKDPIDGLCKKLTYIVED